MVEVPIIDEKTFGEIALPTIGVFCASEVGYRGVVVADIVGDGVGKVPRRVHRTVQYIDDTVANFLAGKMCSHDGRDIFIVGPGHYVDAAGVGDDDGVVARGCDGRDDGGAVSVHVIRDPVLALGDIGLQENEAHLRNGVDRGDGEGSNGVVCDVLD